MKPLSLQDDAFVRCLRRRTTIVRSLSPRPRYWKPVSPRTPSVNWCLLRPCGAQHLRTWGPRGAYVRRRTDAQEMCNVVFLIAGGGLHRRPSIWSFAIAILSFEIVIWGFEIVILSFEISILSFEITFCVLKLWCGAGNIEFLSFECLQF